jgi:hypothetical protein
MNSNRILTNSKRKEKYKRSYCISSYRVMRMLDMDEKTIGLNAGKIWSQLKEHSALTKHQVITNTTLSEEDFHTAVGWLARENKIQKNGEFYQLGLTNLTANIGSNAGTVLKVLQQLPYSVTPIHELTDMTDDELHQAIGWLAKEGKLTEFFMEPELLNLDDTEEKLLRLQEEYKELTFEVSNRNHIINDLSKQLSARQTDFINQTDVVTQLYNQINQNNQQINQLKDEVQIGQSRIHQFTEDISMLIQDVEHRNHIIQDLSRQVTDFQNMLIERTDTLDRLQSIFACLPSNHMLSPTPSTEIHSRIQQIQSLQNQFDEQNIKLGECMPSESKFYGQKSPSLDLQINELSHEPQSSPTIDSIHKNVDERLKERKASLPHPP